MTPSPTRLLFALACCLAMSPAMAAKVTKVEVKGLADAAMEDNVRTALSLSDELDKDLSARRLNYLLRQAEAETREALEPFGYYSPTIVIRRSDRDRPVGAGNANRDAANADASDIAASPAVSADAPASTAIDTAIDTPSTTSVVDDNGRDATTTPRNPARNGNGNGRNNGRTLDVIIEIDLGQPVRVRKHQVGVEGAAQGDKTVTEAVTAFLPRQGEVLDHQRYEASKRTIAASLLRHGYFDAAFAAHRVEVTRADFAADIDLRWTSGERFLLGAASFKQEPKAVIRDSLLAKLVNWDEGEPYDEAKVERLRRSLIALDYFGLVEVSPKPEDAQDKIIQNAQLKNCVFRFAVCKKIPHSLSLNNLPDRHVRRFQLRGRKILQLVQWKSSRAFCPFFQRMVFQTWIIFRQIQTKQFFWCAVQVRAHFIQMIGANAHRLSRKVVVGRFLGNTHLH